MRGVFSPAYFLQVLRRVGDVCFIEISTFVIGDPQISLGAGFVLCDVRDARLSQQRRVSRSLIVTVDFYDNLSFPNEKISQI